MMDFDTIRPRISGVIGAAIAVWLFRPLARRAPEGLGSKRAEELVRENKHKILLCNVAFFASLVSGAGLYCFGYFKQNDWRGVALTVGVATLLPAVLLLITSIGGGKDRVTESYVAYAMSQKIPLRILYGTFALGAICLFAALGTMVGA